MIGITFLLLCVGSVVSQYDFYDSPKESDQIDLIQDINNLVPLENDAIQSNGENQASFHPKGNISELFKIIT